MELYKICVNCGYTIRFDDASNSFFCPHCKTSYATKEILDNKSYISVNDEKLEYNAAIQLYNNGNYAEAKKHFDNVLIMDKNNFYSVYYSSICNLLIGDITRSTSELIANIVLDSMAALERSIVSSEGVLEFTYSVLNQAYSFVKEMLERFANTESISRQTYRYNALAFAKTIRKIIMIQYSLNDRIKKVLLDFCNSMLKFISSAIEPQILNDEVDMPTAVDYSQAKSIAFSFVTFAQSIDPLFKVEDINYRYENNLRMNSNLFTDIISSRGMAFNPYSLAAARGNNSPVLNILKYSYCTCFRNISPNKDSHKRRLLIEQTLDIVLKNIRPYIDITDDGDADLIAVSYQDLQLCAVYLNDFIREMAEYNPAKINSIMEAFYSNLYVSIKSYFDVINVNFKKNGDIIRRQKTKDLYYLRKFFYMVILSSYLGSKEIINYQLHNIDSRYKLLKMGREAGEAFLFLYNYNLDSIVKSSQYSDFINIANIVETDMKRLKN